MTITPNHLLPEGTNVRVGNQIGRVHLARMARDQHGVPICEHFIQFTHARKRLFGTKYRVEEIKNKKTPVAVNYSGIIVLNGVTEPA